MFIRFLKTIGIRLLPARRVSMDWRSITRLKICLKKCVPKNVCIPVK